MSIENLKKLYEGMETAQLERILIGLQEQIDNVVLELNMRRIKRGGKP
jgi:hypothetical protein